MVKASYTSKTVRLQYDPFPLVLHQAPPRGRLYALMAIKAEDSPEAQQALNELLAKQSASGAFPFAEAGYDAPSVNETARTVGLLLDLGFSRHEEPVKRALEWLWRLRYPDGGWREHPALRPVLRRSSLVSFKRPVVWITASAATVLLRAQFVDRKALERTYQLILRAEARVGGWPPVYKKGGPEVPVVDDVVEFLLIYTGDPEYPAIRRALRFLAQTRGMWIHPINAVTVLRTLRFVNRTDSQAFWDVISILVESQREDGGWSVYSGERSHPLLTGIITYELAQAGVEIPTSYEPGSVVSVEEGEQGAE